MPPGICKFEQREIVALRDEAEDVDGPVLQFRRQQHPQMDRGHQRDIGGQRARQRQDRLARGRPRRDRCMSKTADLPAENLAGGTSQGVAFSASERYASEMGALPALRKCTITAIRVPYMVSWAYRARKGRTLEHSLVRVGLPYAREEGYPHPSPRP